MNEQDNSGEQTEAAENEKSLREFWTATLWVLGCVAIVLAIIAVWVVVSFALDPKLTDPIQFVGISVLNTLIFTAVIAQVLIYRKQRDIMRDQRRVMDESLAETRNLIEQTERFARINSRAYVFIDTATLDAPIRTGKYPLAKISLKNSGKSPAFAHRVRIEQAFLSGESLENARKGIMPPMRALNKKGLGIIGANHVFTLHLERDQWKTAEDEKLATEGKSIFYLWGLIAYSDIFGVEHSSKFSLFARNEKVTSLSYGMFGNDFEDEETDQARQTKEKK